MSRRRIKVIMYTFFCFQTPRMIWFEERGYCPLHQNRPWYADVWYLLASFAWFCHFLCRKFPTPQNLYTDECWRILLTTYPPRGGSCFNRHCRLPAFTGTVKPRRVIYFYIILLVNYRVASRIVWFLTWARRYPRPLWQLSRRTHYFWWNFKTRVNFPH